MPPRPASRSSSWPPSTPPRPPARPRSPRGAHAQREPRAQPRAGADLRGGGQHPRLRLRQRLPGQRQRGAALRGHRRPAARGDRRAHQPGRGAGGQVHRARRADAHQRLPGAAAPGVAGAVLEGAQLARRADALGRGAARRRGGGLLQALLVTREHLALLEAFADLAAAACRNASAHAGLVLAARTDALTGCLNHAAMHDSAAPRARALPAHRPQPLAGDRGPRRLQAREREPGPLAGDEVLRRVGHALRQAVRTYDLVARYGGDEFAIVAIDADERAAAEVAQRAIEGVTRAVRRVDRSGGAAGGHRRGGRVAGGRERHRADRARRPCAAVRKAAGPPRRGAARLRAARGLPAGGRATASPCSPARREDASVVRPRPRADRAPAQAHTPAGARQRARGARGGAARSGRAGRRRRWRSCTAASSTSSARCCACAATATWRAWPRAGWASSAWRAGAGRSRWSPA